MFNASNLFDTLMMLLTKLNDRSLIDTIVKFYPTIQMTDFEINTSYCTQFLYQLLNCRVLSRLNQNWFDEGSWKFAFVM